MKKKSYDIVSKFMGSNHEEREYYTDWNRAMGAWNKFQFINMNNASESLKSEYNSWKEKISGSIIDGDILWVHRTLVAAILWYNSTTLTA